MMGDDLACKCWSARGMSSHESARSPTGMFYPSSVGTETSVKSIDTFVRTATTEKVICSGLKLPSVVVSEPL
jgi:hypothetical protein